MIGSMSPSAAIDLFDHLPLFRLLFQVAIVRPVVPLGVIDGQHIRRECGQGLRPRLRVLETQQGPGIAKAPFNLNLWIVPFNVIGAFDCAAVSFSRDVCPVLEELGPDLGRHGVAPILQFLSDGLTGPFNRPGRVLEGAEDPIEKSSFFRFFVIFFHSISSQR